MIYIICNMGCGICWNTVCYIPSSPPSCSIGLVIMRFPKPMATSKWLRYLGLWVGLFNHHQKHAEIRMPRDKKQERDETQTFWNIEIRGSRFMILVFLLACAHDMCNMPPLYSLSYLIPHTIWKRDMLICYVLCHVAMLYWLNNRGYKV